MTTLQEYLNQKYPTKEERKEVGFINMVINCSNSWLTSIDFLNDLPCPEKLEGLWIFSNKIKPTDIAVFSRFKNLERLKIGTMESDLEKGKHNKFYGSFESWKDLSKLEDICIEATDVDRGLEYLPFSLAESIRGGNKYSKIECSPHNTNAKCSAIQNELRPFDYDLEAWQLAHPEKMLIARPEYFTNPDSREQWISALSDKITSSQQELQETKTNLPEKVKRIERLESKINHLAIIKNLLEELAIERDHSQDINNWYQRQLGGENAKRRNDLWNLILELKWNSKQQEQENKQLQENIKISNRILEQECQPKETKNQSTQTDLTGQDYEQQQKTIQELQAQINKLTTKK